MENHMKGAITLEQAGGLALLFVFFVVVVSVGGDVLTGIQSSQTEGGVAFNATASGLTGIVNLANQSPTIGTIIGAAIIIGILVTAFVFSRQS